MGAERIEEIIKKFDLPERQTKINTLLKLHSENEKVYCLCRSSDTDTFMICCEKCDEWYHGACIGLEENEAKLIKKWYCFECIERYRLKIVYFSSSVKKSSSKKGKENRSKIKISNKKRGHCKARLQSVKKNNCLKNRANKKTCTKVRPTKGQPLLDYENHKIDAIDSKIDKPTHSKYVEEEKQPLKLQKSKNMQNKKYLNEMKQKLCQRPGCSKCIQLEPKYCNDDCGANMAKCRLRSVIRQFNTNQNHYKFPSELDILKLENLLIQKKIVFEKLQNLDNKEIKLKNLIAKSKHVPIQEIDQEEDDDDSNTCCVICHLEIPSCSYLTHMAMCFGNFESQIEIVELNKSYLKYSFIFCDYYDSVAKTFCNRLRFVCPKHVTHAKVKSDEVCGFPMTTEMGVERFCQNPKKICKKHCNWENLALSEVDFERFQEWKKINELANEEREIGFQASVAFRGFLQSFNINVPT